MRDKYKTLFVIAGLTIAVLAVLGCVREFGFVYYDDDDYVVKNERISSGLTVESVAWVFTSVYGGHWHPLTGLSHMLDCQLFGLNPAWHHLTSLLLHIINTLLFFAVFRKITGVLWQSAFMAVLFALHPLHVESVAWVSDRKDVLSALFWVLTIGAYFRYAESHRFGWYALALVLFALGLTAKPMLVTLPFVLLLLDYWPLERLEAGRAATDRKYIWRLIIEKIPFFIITGISSVITFLVFEHIGIVKNTQDVLLSVRIGNAVMSYLKYIGKMFWPVKLAAFYPYPERIPAWQILVAAVLLLIITIAVIRLAGKYRYLPVGWFWYIGTLVPVIGLIQVGDQSIADRYTYIPLVGLFIMIAWGANDLLINYRHRKVVLSLASSAVILALSASARSAANYWHDSMSLFDHAIKVTSGNYVAYNGRGLAYFDMGEPDIAISDFNKSIEINPGDAKVYCNLGTAYAQLKGQYDLAISYYNKALAINPRDAETYNNRGNTYKKKGQIDQAIADYSEALRINPRYVEAYYNRGNTYAQGKGELDRAIADYDKSLQINPWLMEAYFSKAVVCEAAGRKKQAIEAYKVFVRNAPPSQYAPDIEYAKSRINQLER